MTPRTGARRLLVPLVPALLLVATLPASASAHAELVRAIPADGETVTKPVTVLSARYSEAVVGNSNLRVLDETGATVATAAIDPEDPRRMIARPDQPLGDGTYTVRSTATSADGHTERLTWTFTVAIPATPSPSPEPTPTPVSPTKVLPTATPSATPSPTPPPTASPSATPGPTDPTSGTGDVLLPIVAALAIVAIGAGFLLRRSRTG
jgi:methionine-rich copper-binding protein CopC